MQLRFFGQPNTPYDFNAVNLKDATKAYNLLKDKYESMRKKINVKVMNMIDKYVLDSIPTFRACLLMSTTNTPIS